jgi:hypothetical protein
MNKFWGLHCILILFISCGTPPAPSNHVDNRIQNTEKYTFSVTINNPTIFNISIDNQVVEKVTIHAPIA